MKHDDFIEQHLERMRAEHREFMRGVRPVTKRKVHKLREYFSWRDGERMAWTACRPNCSLPWGQRERVSKKNTRVTCARCKQRLLKARKGK